MVKAGSRMKSTQEGAAIESVRGRILNTARELFYREGARAVGVDTVVAQSGVAKTSLYRWFASKDALIAAVVEEEARDRWAGWDYNSEHADKDPREQLRAQLSGIARFVTSSRYRGCPFMNVTVEFPDEQHPARLVARQVKEELRRRVRNLVDQMDVTDPAQLTDQIVLLINGALSAGSHTPKSTLQKQLVAAGDALIDAQLSEGGQRTADSGQ